MPALSSYASIPSNVEICEYFRRFKNQANSSWLDIANSIQNGNLPKKLVPLNAISTPDKIAHVSIRGPLHCADGWDYLSRAISALLSGHLHTARHLAYYAELRAGMSVLASQGVFVGNSVNFFVDAAGSISSWSGQGTHEDCWTILGEWAGLAGSFEAIMGSLRINGVDLATTLNHFFPVPPGQRLATNLMKSWGFDLAQGKEDRSTRNLSSYSPNDLTELIGTTQSSCNLLRETWSSIRPADYSLEMHLLRKLLRDQIRNSAVTSLPAYKAQYDRLDDRTKRFFTWKFITASHRSTTHPIHQRAANIAQPVAPDSVICRALLLLRLATSMVGKNFEMSGLSTLQDLEFWWSGFGSARGFYTPASPPDDPIDLWSDIEIALDDLVEPLPDNQYDLINLAPPGFSRLCETDRSVLWTLIK